MDIGRTVHRTVVPHCVTELAILQELRSRSSPQHHTQIFLQRLDQVIRLTRLLVRLGSQSIAHKLHHALVSAVNSSSQVIDLHHFLPLQTVLVASYSRLYAVTLAYIDGVQIVPETGPTPSRSEEVGNEDLGQSLSREDSVPAILPLTATPAMTKAMRAKRKDAMDDIFGI